MNDVRASTPLPLRSLLEQYLTLHRSLGAVFVSTATALTDFIRYVAVEVPDCPYVSRPLISAYLAARGHWAPQTRAARVSHLRQFCRFLHTQDSRTYIPEGRTFPPVRNTHRPYVYSGEDLQRLLDGARAMGPADSLRPDTYSTLIGLLWVSGLRISEALHLTLADVDLEQAVLHIRHAKHFKSRLVPITGSTATALGVYRERRLRIADDRHPPLELLYHASDRFAVHAPSTARSYQTGEREGV